MELCAPEAAVQNCKIRNNRRLAYLALMLILFNASCGGDSAPPASSCDLSGKVHINEVLMGGSGFIELIGNNGLALTGAVLEARDASFGLVASFILTAGDVVDSSGFVVFSMSAMANSGGTVRLLDCTDAIVDAVAWGTGSSLNGEGTPAAAPAGAQSIGRCQGFDDTNDNAADFHPIDTPTSGSANTGFVPPGACP